MTKTSITQKALLFLFGTIICLVLLEMVLQAGGILFFAAQNKQNNSTQIKKNEVKILCIGESTTALGGKSSYPYLLEKVLNSKDKTKTYTVINKGIPGITTPSILNILSKSLKEIRPDYVVSMIGINDKHYGIGSDINISNKHLYKTDPQKHSLKVINLLHLAYIHIKTSINDYRLKSRLSPKELSKHYISLGWFHKAIKSLEKAISINPNDQESYMLLSKVYRWDGYFSQSIDTLNKLLAINPKSDLAYIALGKIYTENNSYSKANNSLTQAIQLNPKTGSAYLQLGILNRKMGNNKNAKLLFLKAIDLGNKTDSLYLNMGEIYLDEKNFKNAEIMLIKSLEINPENELTLNAMTLLYQAIGSIETSKEYSKKRDVLLSKFFSPTTKNNYLAIKDLATSNNATLVAVQYPILSIKPLKHIFRNDKSVVFVDNEALFKDAIQTKGWKNIFTDNFAGVFGHCTKTGNSLLAENIANAILAIPQ